MGVCPTQWTECEYWQYAGNAQANTKWNIEMVGGTIRQMDTEYMLHVANAKPYQ